MRNNNSRHRPQQIDVSFSCVCPVIDYEFRHNIGKVAGDPRGDSRVDSQTDGGGGGGGGGGVGVTVLVFEHF